MLTFALILARAGPSKLYKNISIVEVLKVNRPRKVSKSVDPILCVPNSMQHTTAAFLEAVMLLDETFDLSHDLIAAVDKYL